MTPVTPRIVNDVSHARDINDEKTLYMCQGSIVNAALWYRVVVCSTE